MSKKRQRPKPDEIQEFIAYINEEALPDWTDVAPHIESQYQELRARGLPPLDPPDRHNPSIGTHCILDAAYEYAKRIVPPTHHSKLSKLKPPTGWLNGPDGAAYLESLRDFFQSIKDAEQPKRPILTPTQRATFEIFSALPDGHALLGEKICEELRRREFNTSIGSLTSTVMPTLKEHYGVRNQKRKGYFVSR